jgi:hypothetical protein
MKIGHHILFDKVTASEQPQAQQKFFGLYKSKDIYASVIKAISQAEGYIQFPPCTVAAEKRIVECTGEMIVDRYGALRNGKLLCMNISEATVLSEGQIKRLERWINEEDTPES